MDESINEWNDFVHGDMTSFNRLYKNHVQAMFDYAIRFTTDEELIKDCIHDVFFALYKNRTSMLPPDNIRLYVLISLKNRIFNALNYHSRFERLDKIEYTSEQAATVEHDFIDKEEAFMQTERIKTMLSVLSPRQRSVIYYRYIHELSISEIALLMNLNYQSTSNLLQKALIKIRKNNHLLTTLLIISLTH